MSIEQTKPQNNSPSASGLKTLQCDAVGGDKIGQDKVGGDKVGRDKIEIVDRRTIIVINEAEEETSPLRRWLEWAIIIGQIVQLLLG